MKAFRCAAIAAVSCVAFSVVGSVQAASAGQAGWQVYHDRKLGISFEYSANRHIIACPETHNCLALVGPGMKSGDYFISFNVVEKPLEQAASEDADFVKSGHKWMTQDGPGEPQVVQPFSGKGWTGLKAIIACGVSDSNGEHAGAGNCFWSAISNGKRSVVSDTQGIVGTDADTMRSLNSLQFDR